MNPALAQLMIQQLEQSATAEDPSSAAMKLFLNNAAQASEAREERVDPSRKMQALLKRIKRLNREVSGLTELVAFFANLFGACVKCLGEDERCPVCRGRGGPGFHVPDGEQLVSWAEPALKRLGKHVVDSGDEQVSLYEDEPQEI